jgi:hypothetical protein
MWACMQPEMEKRVRQVPIMTGLSQRAGNMLKQS